MGYGQQAGGTHPTGMDSYLEGQPFLRIEIWGKGGP